MQPASLICTGKRYNTFQDPVTFTYLTFSLPTIYDDNSGGNDADSTDKFFDNDFQRLFDDATESGDPFNCTTILKFLQELSLQPDESEGNISQNIIYIFESTSPCQEFNIFWNRTHRHLEVIIFQKGDNKTFEDFASFIEPSISRQNHVNIYTADFDGPYDTYFEDNTVCTKNPTPKQWEIGLRLPHTTTPGPTRPPPVPEATTTANPQISEPSKTKWYIVAGVFIGILVSALIFIIRSLIHRRRISKNRVFINQALKKQFELCGATTDILHAKRLKNEIDSKNIRIDFNTILGKGSIATVFKGKSSSDVRRSRAKKKHQVLNFRHVED